MAIREDILVELEKGLAAIDQDPTFGSQQVAKVARFWPHIFEPGFGPENFPLIVMDDNGDEPGPEYRGVRRFKTFLNISGVVRADTDQGLTEGIESLSESVRKYLHSEPTLHANVLDISLVETEDQGIFSRSSTRFASSLNRIRILWFDTLKTVAAPSGTDVFGDQWLDDARDSLETRINALKTTMATGYDPTFSNVYARHTVPDLKLNAVTIGVDSVDTEEFSGAQSGISTLYMMQFTVRVHTTYEDEFFDDQDVARLVNSLINKLKDKLQLATGVHIVDISDIGTDLTFAESESRGGEFTVTVRKAVTHTQE